MAITGKERVFAILTVIPEADAAVRRLFKLDEHERKHSISYYRGRLPTSNGPAVQIVTSRCEARSNIPACMAAAAMLQDWEPDYLLVVDIGGGVLREAPPDEVVQLGDVVVHEKLIYYEFRKLKPGDERERSFSFQNPGPSLRQTVLHVQRSEASRAWWNGISVSRPTTTPPNPKIVFGDILCGDKLLGDRKSPLLKELIDSYDKAIAVDMESVGVARAIYDLQPRLQKTVEFLAIRGISDYCNPEDGPAEDNQRTREEWRRYAAEAAACVALEVVREEGRIQTADETIKRYQFALSRALDGLATLENSFALSIRDKKTGEHEYADAMELVTSTGRAVLQGKAGAGKTTVVNTLARAAPSKGYLAVVLNLRKLQLAELSRVMSSDVTLDAQADVLLGTSPVPVSSAMLANMPEGTRFLFLADGLNELSGESQIAWIFETLDAYADRRSASVLITDRPASPNLTTRWQIGILHGVKTAFLDAVLKDSKGEDTFTEDERKLLQLPFYLNWAMDQKDFHVRGAASVHERFFLEHAKLSADDLDVLAAAALDAYVTQRSPEFGIIRFRQEATKEITARLTDAGVIRLVNTATAQFDHQLRHDFLAAREIARHREKWTAPYFDALTFETASLQTLDLAIDQLTSEEAGDDFVRAVYDWNWRAATRCISAAAHREPRVCSRELEVAIACLVAEKQFDPVAHTSESSKAAMRGFRSELGSAVGKLKSREEVWAFPQTLPSTSGWFDEWRALFTGIADDGDRLRAIAGPRSLTGWTAASVIRRSAGVAMVRSLAAVYEQHPKDDVVRWRVVHALGRFDDQQAVEHLLHAVVQDPDQWVRYGAGRSLVEIAATTRAQPRRESIVTTLIARMQDLPDNVKEEIARTALFEGAQPGWAAEALPLVREAQVRANPDLRKKRIGEVATKLATISEQKE